MKSNSKYSAALKMPQWQRMRLRVFERDKFRCRMCNTDSSELHAHHIHYDGPLPHQTPIGRIVTLCQRCHESVHDGKAPDLLSEFTYIFNTGLAVNCNTKGYQVDLMLLEVSALRPSRGNYSWSAFDNDWVAWWGWVGKGFGFETMQSWYDGDMIDCAFHLDAFIRDHWGEA